MSDRGDLDLVAIKHALEEERAALLAERQAAVDQRRPVELDQQNVGRLSRMDALQLQAMAQSVDARRGARLAQIDAALGRIAAGDYGYCVACDDEIAAGRLAVDPTIARCINCAG